MKQRYVLSLVSVVIGGGLVLSAHAQSPPATEASPAPAAPSPTPGRPARSIARR